MKEYKDLTDKEKETCNAINDAAAAVDAAVDAAADNAYDAGAAADAADAAVNKIKKLLLEE